MINTIPIYSCAQDREYCIGEVVKCEDPWHSNSYLYYVASEKGEWCGTVFKKISKEEALRLFELSKLPISIF